MDDLMSFAQAAIPILLLIGVVFFALRRIAKWYRRVSPNTMTVISGRKYRMKGPDGTINERGFRWLVGGGTLVIPILEQAQDMNLNTMQIQALVTDVPDPDGVLVTVEANANVKILSTSEAAPLAIERFLGMSPEQIKVIAKNTVEGNLRAIVSKLTIEDLRKDRTKFMQAVISEAGEELGKMGLGVDGVQIQNVSDRRGYLEAIGKTKTAEIVRDATVGEANAKRDADKQSAEARKIGETAQAESLKAISDANRDRDVAIAENEALVAAKRAQVSIAAEIAAANRTKDLNIARVDAEKAGVTAGITLQEETAKRNAAEYQATIVVKAEKEREATVIGADARRQAAELDGEAFRLKSTKEGQGIQAQQTGEAEGRKQLASANQAELVAKAEGEKAGLLAVAAGKLADLEAEGKGQLVLAAGLQAKLLAEAAGVAAKAEAYSKLDPTGRMLMLLAALPPVIEALGEAVRKTAEPFAEAMGEGLGNIDEVRLIDMGGGSAGKNMLTQFAATPVEALYGIIQKLRATQFWPVIEGLAKQAGIDVDALAATVGSGGRPAQAEASKAEAQT